MTNRSVHGISEGYTLSNWRDCIIVLMDLIGIKRRALMGDRRASKLMRAFHQLVRNEIDSGCRPVDQAYVWNDSVILLAYLDRRKGRYEKIMQAIDALKRKVDLLAPSYAIAVEGQTFPAYPNLDTSRVVTIKASSYAMANCFKIEAKVKKNKIRNKFWYVDTRIAKKVPGAKADEWITVHMLPGGNPRTVYMHSSYLWANLK